MITTGIGGGLGFSDGFNTLLRSNYNSINDLGGVGAAFGGTVTFLGLACAAGKGYSGLSLAGWVESSLEFHALISYTWVIPIRRTT